MRLLGRDDAEPVSSGGLAPLAGVVRCRYVGAVETLLGCPGVDLPVDLRDGDGCLLRLAVRRF